MKKIFVAGHNGMVGSAICRKLLKQQNIELITQTRKQLDLCDQKKVFDFMKSEKPDEVILAAAKVGGIYANNTYPADFIYENLQIQNNLIHASHLCDVQKLLFLGSSCIYPKTQHQPIKENRLLTGLLESTNEPYAIAKIAGIKTCESYNRQFGRDYRSIMPTNLYGPGDNYDLLNSHVMPALIRRFHEAKQNNKGKVIVWGTGSPRREFLHVDDMADASIHIHNLSAKTIGSHTSAMTSHINVGTGIDISIKDLAELIKSIIGFDGDIEFDTSKPDGTPKKLLDVSLINSLGWKHQIAIETGIRMSYQAFVSNLR